jgi:hypothetical protein
MNIKFHFVGKNRRAFFKCDEQICLYNNLGQCCNSKAEVIANGTTNDIRCNGFRAASHKQFPDYIDFILHWIGARNSKGEKILPDSSVRVYFALIAMEAKYEYAPGSEMEFSWKEIGSFSCHVRHYIGRALTQLNNLGLIEYHKGVARAKGCKTMVRRILPIPKPESNLKNLR